jgi:hypothetical protein
VMTHFLINPYLKAFVCLFVCSFVCLFSLRRARRSLSVIPR